jgi:hypothetical protein
MTLVPGGGDASRGPPTTVPLRHVLVALAFLVVGVGVGVGNAVGVVPGRGDVTHLHLVLLGWVGVTIMGAMTQFVPVWSGVSLHSTRLANAQLALAVVGVTTFATAWILVDWTILAIGGTLLLAAVSTFAYNVARTLQAIGPVSGWDVTARHFAYALLAFALLASLGFLLALDYATGVLGTLGLAHGAVRDAHVTIAVFGAVATTIYGALYQLATTFTQTELHASDRWLQRVEEVAHPVGVLLLASGRLADWVLVARIGALGVLVGAGAVAVVLARRLLETRVEIGPLHVRYGVAALALAAWAALSTPAWLGSPLGSGTVFGADGVGATLLVAAIGFVVAGTLYHVVPFLVWVDRYSDRLGFEPVPMIDDLYDDRVARADLVLLVSATIVAVAGGWLSLPWYAFAAAAIAGTLGVALLVGNLVLVVHRHGTVPLDGVLLGALAPDDRSQRDLDRP